MTSRQKIFGVIGAVLLSFTASGTAWAATYYVSTSGSDSNPGTQAAPFKTIAKGSQRMASGDTLYIRAGTYNEAMFHGQDGFKFTNGTSASAMTRYAAYEGERVTIKPPPGPFVAWFPTSAKDIELRGLVLDGVNAQYYVVRLDYSSTTGWPRNIRIIGNELMNSRLGIGGGGDCQIIGNRIHHMRGYGIYTGGRNGLIEGNIIHDNGGFAIHHYQSNQERVPINDWIIRNNTMFRNGRGYLHGATGDRVRFAPAVTLYGPRTQFYNNIIYDNYAGVGGPAQDTLIANNTVYGNDGYGISFRGSNPRIINNISWGNGGSAQIASTGTRTTLQNNLTTDPKFVNAGGGDFGIQEGSPAIDKGMTLAEVKTDFTGKKRPEGAAYDIGAFEGAGSRKDAIPAMPGGLPLGGVGGAGSVGSGAGGGSLGLGNCLK